MAGSLTWNLMVVIGFVLELSSVLGLSQDGQALLQFKDAMDDPDGALLSWNESDALPCLWNGVVCEGDMVTGVFLSNANIIGPVPAVLCQLPKLTKLVLSWNYLNGSFPSGLLDCGLLELLDLSNNLIVSPLPADINKLHSLTVLDLSFNNFSGLIPPAFGDLPSLQVLNLSANLLYGNVPGEIGKLSNLVELVAENNSFTGVLPWELGKLSHLELLSVTYCELSGKIPSSLGHANLTQLYLNGNYLSGPIPAELGNLTGLQMLDLSRNSLSDRIPPELMLLPNLQSLQLWSNELTGEIPAEIANLTSMEQFDVSTNKLDGSIPEGLSQISTLKVIRASQNHLSGGIPLGFGTLPNLRDLSLFENLLIGVIPPKLGELSALENLDLSSNFLIGTLPPSLCAGGVLAQLILMENKLSGSLPEGLGNCPSLKRLRLENNLLTGNVPLGLWGSPTLKYFSLSNNLLNGSIGTEIGHASALTALLVDNNQFEGVLPAALGNISVLTEFLASRNRLVGNLPVELGQLQKLNKLELGENLFNGSIPVALGNCQRLDKLILSGNHFVGVIPPELGNLPALNSLDLSHNELTGPIPPELGNLQLTEYNFSYNNLSGELPASFSSSFVLSSFEGNPGLDLCPEEGQCGTPQSDIGSSLPSHHASLAWAAATSFAAAALIFSLGACCFWKRYSIQYYYWKNRRHDKQLTWSLRSFQKVKFFQEELMDSLDESSLIGSGRSGKVYRTALSNGQVVAVKKLEARQDNCFKAEVETLGRIRHRNIVKLLCCCSNHEANLLIYEYMPNGSLCDYLHSSKAPAFLDWGTRFRIAMGAAEGLSYLHHDSAPPIVHRDVKSNNILLDLDFEAHLGDFGLAKVFDAESMSSVAGSYGYIAPEYAYTLKVTEKSDIYSFGVVLLELVSGRKPVEPEFGDFDLVRWVSQKVQTKAGALEVLDESIRPAAEEDMLKVLKIGLLCTSFSHSDRPSMREVVRMLLEASPKG